jgi:hypothetical protein
MCQGFDSTIERQRRKMPRKLDAEQVLLILVGISSIAIALLDFLGLIGTNSFLSGQTSTLSLLVLGMIASYLAFERKNKLDKIEALVSQGFDTTILSLGGGAVQQFSDSGELYDYLASRISQAEKSVDDLTWGEISATVTTRQQDKSFSKYLSAIEKCIGTGKVRYREIMTFPNAGKLREERLSRAERMITGGFFNYELAYYRFDHKYAPPLVQFLVIDSKEVIIAFYRGVNLPLEGTIHFSTRHPLLVSFFQDYFEAICHGGIFLKRAGGVPNLEELKKIQTGKYD